MAKAPSIHACAIPDCGKLIGSHLLMCRPHWYLVPRKLQLAIIQHYVPGQEAGIARSEQYISAVNQAISAVRGQHERSGIST